MERREMILKLGDFFRVKPKYLGVPSFAYEIATEEETYTLDRQGLIKTSEGQVLTFEEITGVKQSKPQIQAEAKDTPTDYEIPVNGFEIQFPITGHSGTTLQNIVNMITSKQALIARSFDIKEPLIDEDFTETLNLKDTRTVEDFRDSFFDAGPEKCKGLIFDFEGGTFTFNLIADGLTQEKIRAFTDLAVFINKNAKALKYASFKPAQDDNPKYAFRTWLIRLGMNGDAYKATRKVLLANLEGSSAFRKVGA